MEKQLLLVNPGASAGCIATAILPNPNPTISHLPVPVPVSEGRYFCLVVQYCPPPCRFERALALNSPLPFSPPAYCTSFPFIIQTGELGGACILVPRCSAPSILGSVAWPGRRLRTTNPSTSAPAASLSLSSPLHTYSSSLLATTRVASVLNNCLQALYFRDSRSTRQTT